MSTMDEQTIPNIRKRRGVIRASNTKLANCLRDLNSRVHESSTLSLAQKMKQRLESLDSDFKVQHFALIDTIHPDDEETLSKEQEVLDGHDDDITTLSVRVKQLVNTCSSASDSGARKIASRSLTDLNKRLAAAKTAATTLSGKPEETHLLHQYQEQLTDFKGNNSAVSDTMFCLLAESEELQATIATADKEIFDLSLLVRKFLYTHSEAPNDATSTASNPGVKLTKLDVPTFDGDIFNWKTFWEQFRVAIHNHTHLSNAEKLAYLRHSLKDGTAKNVIAGLSHFGDHYSEAIECLTTRYDRPRLIHQAHVRKISEISHLKDGSEKELRYLHELAS